MEKYGCMYVWRRAKHQCQKIIEFNDEASIVTPSIFKKLDVLDKVLVKCWEHKS
jgi:hypothetical protein